MQSTRRSPGKLPDATDLLASPPALCRLENRVDRPTLLKISEVLLDQFLAAQKTPPGHLTIHFDAIDVPIHGQQAGRFCHGYYDHSFPP